MDGRTDGRMDGWMNGWMDGWVGTASMHERTAWMDTWTASVDETDACLDEQMHVWMNRYMFG